MDADRVRAYLQVACAGLGFDIGEVWWMSNESGTSTVAAIGALLVSLIIYLLVSTMIILGNALIYHPQNATLCFQKQRTGKRLALAMR